MSLFKEWLWSGKNNNAEPDNVIEDEEKEHPSLFKVDGDDISDVQPKTEVLRMIDIQKRRLNKDLALTNENMKKIVYVADGNVVFDFKSKKDSMKIELSRVDSSLKILKWYMHLSTRHTWATKEVMEAFVLAAASYHGLDLVELP